MTSDRRAITNALAGFVGRVVTPDVIEEITVAVLKVDMINNCEILTRGETDFSLSNMDRYAVIPLEVFQAMGGPNHPAYRAGIERALAAMQDSLKAGADQKIADRDEFSSCGDE